MQQNASMEWLEWPMLKRSGLKLSGRSTHDSCDFVETDKTPNVFCMRAGVLRFCCSSVCDVMQYIIIAGSELPTFRYHLLLGGRPRIRLLLT
jgi:hypothetical protein